MTRPRSLVFHGRVEAVGSWLDPSLVGEREARRRVLRLLGPRAEVRRAAGGYLVFFGETRAVDADGTDGAAVVRRGDSFTLAPLRDDEWTGLDAPSGSVVLVRGGRAGVVPSVELEVIDVASWLDVGELTVVDVETFCGAAPQGQAPRVVAEPVSRDVREVLGDAVPEPSAEREALLDRLRSITKGEGRGAASDSGQGGASAGGLRRWLDWLLGSSSESAAITGSVRGHPVGPPRPATPSEPGRLRRWLGRIVLGSPLAQLIGRRQAKYIEETLRMFERGELDDALRHAIPFSSLPGAQAPHALDVPSARDSLELSPRVGAGPTSSIGLGTELYEHFKALYRRAARTLEVQGRIEEAAYVCFELLHDEEEGVALLERHARFELAAQMAEGRKLAPGLVIRLWFLAKDVERAMLVARRTGAYADAIARLQSRNPGAAAYLRVRWGDRLAAAGDFAAAVDAVWPVTESRHVARAWLDEAIRFGGPTGMRMLVRKLELISDEPEALAHVQSIVSGVLDEREDDAAGLRASLAEHWARMPKPWSPPVSAMGRALGRRVMLDASDSGRPDPARALLRALDDPLLQMDADAALVRTEPDRIALQTTVLPRHEHGLHAVEDAVVLPRGRLLLALGEAGILLVDRLGKPLRRYEHPASRLVVSDSGSRVIALAARGAVTTLTRIDLATGRARRWCDARFVAAVDSYDGSGWFITTNDALAMVDAQAEGLDVLWRVGQLGHPIVALERDAGRLVMALHHQREGTLELWHYELGAGGPTLRLREPLTLPGDPPHRVEVRVHPSGSIVAVAAALFDEEASVLVRGPRGSTTTTAAVREGTPELVLPREHDCLQLRLDEGGTARLAAQGFSSGVVPADTDALELEGAGPLRLRITKEQVLVIDGAGRVVLLDEHLAVVRSWLV